MKGFDENFVVCEDYDLWLKLRLNEVGYIKNLLLLNMEGIMTSFTKI